MLFTVLFGSIYYALISSYSMHWFYAALWMVPIYAASIVILGLCSYGGFRRVHLLANVRRALEGAPESAVLVCRNRKVGLVGGLDEEDVTPLWGGFLTWRGGPRLARRVRKMATKTFLLTLAVFVLWSLPVFAISIWVGLSIHWTGFLVAASVAVSQFVVMIPLPHVLNELLADVLW